MNRTIVILRSKYKDSKGVIRCFDSVSACAIYFAHEARRQYAERGLTVGELFNAVVSEVALLFAGSATTGEDPCEVHGGDENTTYSFELRSYSDVNTVIAEARAEDGSNHKLRKGTKK